MTKEEINKIEVIDPVTVKPDCKCVTCKCGNNAFRETKNNT